jgi:hypothetical protein
MNRESCQSYREVIKREEECKSRDMLERINLFLFIVSSLYHC